MPYSYEKGFFFISGITANTVKVQYVAQVMLRLRINDFQISLEADVIAWIPYYALL